MLKRRKLNSLNTQQSIKTLKGRRIILRSLIPEDFEQWKEVRLHNQEWLYPWEPRRISGAEDSATNKRAFESRCMAWELERQHGRGHQFGIFLPDKPDQLIGEINISAIHRGVFQSCSVGYWMDERYAGSGYTPEALALLYKYIFESLDLHRVQIAIIPRNVPSLRVVEKLGLRKEGLAKGYLKICGQWEDHYIFAMTSEEYEDKKTDLSQKWLD